MPNLYYEYQESQKIAASGYSFYGLIMAAMRLADTDNLEQLKLGFPNVWRELQDRYNALGGFLDEVEEIAYGTPPMHKDKE